MVKVSEREDIDLESEIESLSTIRENLVSEISDLEIRIEKQRETLDERRSDDDDLYVFDDGDKAANDFDDFFAKTDPEVEKIRSDLMNDSTPKRRFAALSARLGV